MCLWDGVETRSPFIPFVSILAAPKFSIYFCSIGRGFSLKIGFPIRD